MEGCPRDVASVVLGRLNFLECLKMRLVNRRWNNLVVQCTKVWRAAKDTTGENFLRSLWRKKAAQARDILRQRKYRKHINKQKQIIKKWRLEVKGFRVFASTQKSGPDQVMRGIWSNVHLWETRIQDASQKLEKLETEEAYYRRQNVDANELTFIF